MHFFVYGTLTDRQTAAELLDAVQYRGPAVLVGLHRVDGQYPTLLPGGEVRGRLLETDRVATLDRYEGVEDGLYARISLPRASGGTVQSYVGDPSRLGLPESWPGEGLFETRLQQYLDAHEIVVRKSV